MEEKALIREEKLKDQIVALESELKNVKKSKNLEISLIERSNKIKLKRAHKQIRKMKEVLKAIKNTMEIVD